MSSSSLPQRQTRSNRHKPATATTISSDSRWPLALLVLGLAAVALASAGLLVLTLGVAFLIFAGLVFGVFLSGIAGWLANHTPLRYRASYGVVVIALFALLTGGGFYLGTQITQRADRFVQQLQAAIDEVGSRYQTPSWLQQMLPEGETLPTAILSQGDTVLPKMINGLQWLSWGATGALVILFVGLYAAYDPQLYRTGLVKLFPLHRRDQIRAVLEQLHSALGRWIVGRLVSMAIVGVLTAIGLWLFGVPLPITLGAIAAILTFIPNLGPLLAAIPQVLLALNVGTSTALYVLLFNVGLQTVESYLITPMIQRHEVTLPPILTIAAQLMLGVLVGIIGVMMAAPLMVVALVLIQMLYIRESLGDPHPGALTERS